MIELCHRLCLCLEALAELLICGKLAWQNFYGNHSLKRALGGLIYSTHPTAGDEGMDIVGGEKPCDFAKIRRLKCGCVFGITHSKFLAKIIFPSRRCKYIRVISEINSGFSKSSEISHSEALSHLSKMIPTGIEPVSKV